MECADVRAVLRGGQPRSADVATHVAGCSACATLVEHPGLGARLDAIAIEDDGMAPLLARTLAGLDQERGFVARLRALSSTTRVATAVTIAIAIPLAVLLFSRRVDLGVYPGVRLAIELALYGVPALIGVVIALWPLHRPTPLRTRALVVIGGLLGALLIASLPAAHTDHAASLAGAGDDLAKRALGCFAYGSICMLPIFLALRMLGREDQRLGSKAIVVAVAAALCGSLAVFIHCPIVHASHRWAGHVAVLLPAIAWILWHEHRSRRR